MALFGSILFGRLNQDFRLLAWCVDPCHTHDLCCLLDLLLSRQSSLQRVLITSYLPVQLDGIRVNVIVNNIAHKGLLSFVKPPTIWVWVFAGVFCLHIMVCKLFGGAVQMTRHSVLW